jgi:CubicO group peptidase (beta-lactamase class C family)
LTLDDPLTRFFPDWPGGEAVTVRQLLGHTSGIRSYTGMSEWAPTRRTDLSLAELMSLFRDEPYDFEPGERWSYNNSGYVLLGAIIEQVSGVSYADFVETRIFEPTRHEQLELRRCVADHAEPDPRLLAAAATTWVNCRVPQHDAPARGGFAALDGGRPGPVGCGHRPGRPAGRGRLAGRR